jgi:hypothetical protein
MAHNIPAEIFDELLKATGESLKPLGFVQRGPVFRLLAHGNCGLIEFQRSDKSSEEILVFTVNLGVVCGELLDAGSSGAQKARIIDAHLRQRVGMLLPDRPDKWWEVTASTDRVSFVQEIVDLLMKKGAPYVESHLATKALLALWESGQSPGLTVFQRTRFISKLKESQSPGI